MIFGFKGCWNMLCILCRDRSEHGSIQTYKTDRDWATSDFYKNSMWEIILIQAFVFKNFFENCVSVEEINWRLHHGQRASSQLTNKGLVYGDLRIYIHLKSV